MLTFHAVQDQHLVPVGADAAAAGDVVWIDLVHPTPEEDKWVENLLGIAVPTREDMAEIEVSSRLYRENDAIYMTASLLQGSQGPLPETSPVTFILAKGRLVTVRYAEPGVFSAFTKQAQRADLNLTDADTAFAALLEAIIDRTADILERVGLNVDAISREVFQNEDDSRSGSKDYRKLLSRIGRSGDLNSKVRESLVSVGRLVNFISAECAATRPALRDRTETMAADIRSIADHSSYVAGTIVFLLDATLGLISIQQNNIIKIVSVVSVVIMPPTLIASIYGMNFDFMPELHWRIGYPLALLAMAVAAVIPYWYFRRRGWL
jgi:magnesium transporter